MSESTTDQSDDDGDFKRDAAQTVRQIHEQLKVQEIMFEANVESMRHSAKLLKARFDALVEAGFSEVYALEVIKVRGLS